MGAAASVVKGETLNDCGKWAVDWNEDVPNDLFAKEMWMRCPQSDGLTSILSNQSGRDAFVHFLRNDFAEKHLWFFTAVDDDRNGKAVDEDTLNHDVIRIVHDYVRSNDEAKVDLPAELRESLIQMTATTTNRELLEKIRESRDEALNIMAISAFPKFLLSSTFLEWREEEASHVQQMVEFQASEGNDGTVVIPPSSVQHTQSIQHIMSAELNRVLDCTTWLKGLLASIESLPVCVSLAAASRHLQGFPLIYVNSEFEKVTGYEREEIIGQNCRFLQHGKKPEHVAEADSSRRYV